MKRGLFEHLFTRRSLVRGSARAAIVLTAGNVVACASKKTTSKLAIVHTNDSHGHDLLDDESLGFAAAAQLKADFEAQGYQVLLLDAGDAAQGANLVNFYKGDSAIDFMNACGYDAMCVGNHEFSFGQEKIVDYVAQANFPLLSANTIVAATGEPLVEQRVVLTLDDGTKVGVFGLTTPTTQTTANPLFVEGLSYIQGENLYHLAQEQADALRAEGCELVVCLAHLGEEDGCALNRACDVVAHTTGIDLVIDGHDHLEEQALLKNADGNDVLVVETGCYTHAVGSVTWEDGKLASELWAYGSYEGQDPTVASMIQAVSDEMSAELSGFVATTAYALDGERNPGLRIHETNLGDLVADAMLWEAKRMADDEPDCAVVNAGSIRSSVKPGDITLGIVLDVQPFLDYVCTVKVTGSALLEALEASCARNPEELGAFPQVSGISFTLDTKVPFEEGDAYPDSTYASPANPGSRVTIHDVGGRGFDLEDTYVVAATNFLCAGGDTYYAFAEAAQDSMATINYLVSECLRYYLEEECAGEVPERYADPMGEGRIEILS